MVHREAPPLVAVRWLHLAPLLAVCSCNDGPASPPVGSGGQGLGRPGGGSPDTAGNVYVSNTYTVTVYAPGASGNVAPIRTIESSSEVGGIALDTPGNLYVASRDVITVYATANGNATPIRTISGSNTGLGCPAGLRL